MCAAVLAVATVPGRAIAEVYPSKPVTIVVPFSPGGATDVVARTIADKLTQRLGKPVIVENKPGGGGAVANDYVRRQPADGYTLYGVATPFSTAPITNPAVHKYDPITDFTPIVRTSEMLTAIAVNNSFPANSIAEPNAGTASTALATKAAIDGDTIVLNGRKHYVSNVPDAGLFIIYGRVSKAPRAKGIGAVLLERGTPGFTIDRLSENMAGHFQADLLFEDCRVPARNLLVGENGFATLTHCYNLERCGGTAMVLGAAIGAYDRAIEHVATREQFGRALVDFQAVQLKVADMAIQIQAARLMLYHALANGGEWPDPMESSMVKIFGNETAKNVSDTAIQLFGGAGYLKESGIERRYRYVRGYSIAGGPLDIHRTMIAGWLTDRRFSQWAG
jgi:hypothetical protein